MSFYDRAGKMAITSRLRHVSDLFAEDRRRIYDLYDVGLDPKWFPAFYVLSQAPDGMCTNDVADEIGHSHASASQIVKAMTEAGWVESRRSRDDGRRNVIRLTEQAKSRLPGIEEQYADVTEAVEELLAAAHSDLWHALQEVELLLAERRLYDRVKDKFRARLESRTRMIDYTPEHASAFRDLNLEWIEQYFELEESDRRALDDPDTHILKPGGAILMAEFDGVIVGTCALIRMDGQRFELAKMAVSPSAQGKGIGRALGQGVLDKAHRLGARSVFLESNTRLEPAIALYRKLGFRRITGPPSSYARCNIQMEVQLDSLKRIAS